MGQELITMSKKELKRLKTMEELIEKRISQKEAAEALMISTRQVRRLKEKHHKEGANGLVSKHRGKFSNNRIIQEKKDRIMSIVEMSYSDFGPTLAAEKLKIDEENISKETVRKWMIEKGLWKAKSRKERQIHQTRQRRPCFGELIQIDGSPHDWFEGRRDGCTLLVFIDDATGEYMHLRFESETTEGYARATRNT
jgi:hypothetical protein